MLRHVLRLILAVLASASVVGGADALEKTPHEWPMYKGNPGFTGVSADDSVKPPFKLVWSYRTDGDTSGDAGAAVIVGGGKVFAISYNTGSLLALDAESGDFCWEFKFMNGSYVKSPVYFDGRLYVWRLQKGLSISSDVIALNVHDGKEIWTKSFKCKGLDGGRHGLALSDGRLYCPDGDGKNEPDVVALNARTGDEAWRTSLGLEDGAFIITPSVAGGMVFTGTREDFTDRGKKGSTLALDAATGKVKWRVKDYVPFGPVCSDGRIAIVTSGWRERLTHALDAKTGAWLWTTPPVGSLPNLRPTILPDKILAKSAGSSYFTALDRMTGKKLWKTEPRLFSGCSAVSVSGHYAYYGTGCPSSFGDYEAPQAWWLVDAPGEKGIGVSMKAVDLETGQEVWSFPTGDNVCGEPAIAYGKLYFNSRDGRVYCFAPAKTVAEAVPDAKDKSPNMLLEEAQRLLAPELADHPRPGKDWPMWGCTPLRAGIEGTVLNAPLAEAWTFNTGGRILTAAAIRDGQVFIGSDSGKLFALDLQSGKQAWEFQTGAKVRCSPAVVGGLVYCGSDDGHFFALDAATGAKQWAFECGGPVRGSSAVSRGVVVFGADDHHTYALDRKTGRKLWRFRGSLYNHQTPPVIHGDKVLAAQWLNWARALDLASGKELWKTFAPVTIEALASHRDRFYLRTPYYVMEYEPETGKRLRMGLAACGWGGMGFAGRRLFISGIIGQYGTGPTVIDLDGPGKEPKKIKTLEEVRWLDQKRLHGNVRSMGTPLTLGDKVCFATVSGEIVLTDLDGKRLWSATLGDTCHATPVAADGVLVVGCDDGNVYAFRTTGRKE